jgi:3-phosphoshikimate 1-carboxyvinyltransferase
MNEKKVIHLFAPKGCKSANIQLSGSKSISNRVLLIKALCKYPFEITNLSDSDDTKIMSRLLSQSEGETYDAHHAGTAYRFLTAYLATKQGTQILTGSSRMKQRPIKILVDALNELGANIKYLEHEGFPPLEINAPTKEWKSHITLPADISSQYITALLLIAPTLQQGLTIKLEGTIVSRPYIEMTLQIMSKFGIKYSWDGDTIKIKNQTYEPETFHVEADCIKIVCKEMRQSVQLLKIMA